MIVIKSFKISDDKAINDYLKEGILVENMPIMTSDGHIAFVCEDGKEISNRHRVLKKVAKINSLYGQIDIINHDLNTKLAIQKDLTAEIDKLEKDLDTTPSGKESYDKNKNIEKRLKVLKPNLSGMDSEIFSTQRAISEMLNEVEMYKKEIGELGGLE